MSKFVEIEFCNDCRHKIHQHHRYYCGKTYRETKIDCPIPDWCPIPDASSKPKKRKPKSENQRRRVAINGGYNRGPSFGLFLDFGVSYRELGYNNIGQYTTAIVELMGGQIKEVPVDDIKFID